MSLLADLVTILSADYGWIYVSLIVAEQLGNPLWETRTQQLLKGPEGDIKKIKERQKAQIQVIRALASKEEEIDNEAVDDYLVKNGVTIDTFFQNEEGEE